MFLRYEMTSKTSGVDELGGRVTKNWIYATYICCENFIRRIYFSYRVQIKRTTEKETHTHTHTHRESIATNILAKSGSVQHRRWANVCPGKGCSWRLWTYRSITSLNQSNRHRIPQRFDVNNYHVASESRMVTSWYFIHYYNSQLNKRFNIHIDRYTAGTRYDATFYRRVTHGGCPMARP